MIVKEVLSFLEKKFPYELAADFDYNKIGLTIGDSKQNVTNVLFALDLTLDVIDEAIKKQCNLIVCHHPFTFAPLTKILLDDEKGSLVYKMIKNDISLIAMHTNMDLGKGGVADTLCEMLDIKNSNYGINAKDEYVRYGEIEQIKLSCLCNKVKDVFDLDGVKYVGDPNQKISKIGILGGSGGHESDILNAVKKGCQCYITGEIKHHIALMAKYYNLSLIEVNHGIEKYVFDKLSKELADNLSIKTFVSTIDSNLFKFV